MSKIKIYPNKKKNVYALCFLLCVAFNSLSEEALPLKIISSSNPDSRRNNSFVHVNNHAEVTQGVKKSTQEASLQLQIPFVVDLPLELKDNESVQWLITTKKRYIGDVNILSRHKFIKNKLDKGFQWESGFLDKNIEDHQRLVFRPKPLRHQQPIYKKGKGGSGKRQRYGGGTAKIDDRQYNPRLSYQIMANVRDTSGQLRFHKGSIEMDNKDMVRQEYINHFKINRYGRGGYGNLPVPLREELSVIPPMPVKLLGNGLSESRYGLMIDDGLTDLAISVVKIYEDSKRNYKSSGLKLFDLNKKKLSIPDSELWLSGGWRNPERNEWYSNALNGIHQRGGAIDIVANEAQADKRAAIVYWFLWKSLQESNLNAFWQLETRGRPMVTREFKEDIEPKNGIPDAFDKADHIHINIKYK